MKYYWHFDTAAARHTTIDYAYLALLSSVIDMEFLDAARHAGALSIKNQFDVYG